MELIFGDIQLFISPLTFVAIAVMFVAHSCLKVGIHLLSR
jgi:hypothetical protein